GRRANNNIADGALGIELARWIEEDVFVPDFEGTTWQCIVTGGKNRFEVPRLQAVSSETLLRIVEVDAFGQNAAAINTGYFGRSLERSLDECSEVVEFAIRVL